MASLDRAELKQQFQKYDKNNDQRIDWQEVGVHLTCFLFVAHIQ
jgi:Ca2+-binding EF-hand superfamily protein